MIFLSLGNHRESCWIIYHTYSLWIINLMLVISLKILQLILECTMKLLQMRFHIHSLWKNAFQIFLWNVMKWLSIFQASAAFYNRVCLIEYLSSFIVIKYIFNLFDVVIQLDCCYFRQIFITYSGCFKIGLTIFIASLRWFLKQEVSSLLILLGKI